VRLFVAVEIPDDLRDAIENDVVGALRDRVPGARWTRPEGRHLTLAFLGNVSEDRVGDIKKALASTASRNVPFDASFDAVGGFPNLRRPRVLWIGIGAGAEPMSALARALSLALEPLGFPPEDRRFEGHLTLARFKQPKIIEVPAVAAPPDSFPVTEIVLFESRLHPQGARYEARDRFALGS
jgi:2'-5' RNA ligase